MAKDLDFSSYYLCLASGENKLLEEFVKVRNTLPKDKSFHIEVTGLHAGDIMIGRVHPMNDENKWVRENFVTTIIDHFQPLILIERKTIYDFSSSFRSNHYHNQKSRMITFREQTNCLCALVVEEFNEVKEFQNKVGSIPIATLEQCFTSIRVRDRFLVEHVDSVSKHASFILRCLKTIEKYQLYRDNWGNEKINNDNLHKDFQESLKVRKKENMTPELCYRIQLSSIPSISLNMANKIADIYPNMPTLIQALEKNGTKCLSDIQLDKVKLGKVKSERIHQYLLG